MEFSMSKEELVLIVSSCQERSYAEEIQLLQKQSANDVEWLMRGINTHSHKGIASDAPSIALRKTAYGNNEKQVKEPPSFLALVWEAMQDFILRILLVVAIVLIIIEVSLAAEEDRQKAWIEGFAILIAVFVCAFVTAFNDYQKERQFLKLNSVADEKKRVTLYRDGVLLQIHQDLVLVGDLVMINEGMEIPADGILIESNDITTDESAMTGEIDPVHKNVLKNCVKKKEELQRSGEKDPNNKHEVPSPIMMSGTRVLTGEGRMIVLVVGPRSCLGKILALLQKEDDQETPLQQKLEIIAKDIGKFGLISAIVILVVLMIRFAVVKGTKQPWDTSKDVVKLLQYVIIAITVVVVAIPEGLPLSVTLSLAVSVRKMLQDQNLVRKMQACETMGGANNICSDKTGTLTMNKMTLTEIWNGSILKVNTYAQKLTTESLSQNKDYVEYFKIASILNSAALLEPEEKGSSTEISILKYLTKMDIDIEKYRSQFEIVRKFPFNSGRKRMSIILNYKDELHLFIKGASQIILQSAQFWLNPKTNTIQKIDSQFRRQLNEIITGMAEQTLRTLCLGYKPIKRQDYEAKDSKGVYQIQKGSIILIAILGVKDIPRKEVPQAIKKCHRAGITVRMVTGDNIITAKAIAKQIGLVNQTDKPGVAMQGPQFNKLVGGVICKLCRVNICDCPTDPKKAEELKKQLRVDTIGNGQEFDKLKDTLLILARSRPQDKYCLVTGLKERGNVVAVTGDGTNDAPALKKADVGFAMGLSGTQVARSAAAIILIDDNFSSIVQAVLWGRNIYDSIKKFIQFQLTVNVVAVVSTLIGAAILQKEVLKPIQMLWVNLIMDTLASLALATESPNQNLLLRKPHSRDDYIVSKAMMKHILGQSTFQIIIMCIIIFHGPNFIPEEIDALDYNTIYMANPQYKWLNGVVGGNICSGRFYTPNGQPDYSTAFDKTKNYSRHFTFIFNTFVWMQIFNFINSRKIHQEFNILAGITKNNIFPLVVVGIIGLQILLVTFTGYAFGVYSNGLTIRQWFMCIGFGSISILVNFLLKLIPIGREQNHHDSQKVQPMKAMDKVMDNNTLTDNQALNNKDSYFQGQFFAIKKEETSFNSFT